MSAVSQACLAGLLVLCAALPTRADESPEVKKPAFRFVTTEDEASTPDQKSNQTQLKVSGKTSKAHTHGAQGVTFSHPPTPRQSVSRPIVATSDDVSSAATTSQPATGFRFAGDQQSPPDRRRSDKQMSLTIDGHQKQPVRGATPTQGFSFADTPPEPTPAKSLATSGEPQPTPAAHLAPQPAPLKSLRAIPSTTTAAASSAPLVPIRQRAPAAASTPATVSSRPAGVVRIDVLAPEQPAAAQSQGDDSWATPAVGAERPVASRSAEPVTHDETPTWAAPNFSESPATAAADNDWAVPADDTHTASDAVLTEDWAATEPATSSRHELDLTEYVAVVSEQLLLLPISIDLTAEQPIDMTERAPSVATRSEKPAVPHRFESLDPSQLDTQIIPTYYGATKPDLPTTTANTSSGWTPPGPSRASRPVGALPAPESSDVSWPAEEAEPNRLEEPAQPARVAALLDDLEPESPGGAELPGEAEALTPPAARDEQLSAEQTLGEAPEESDQPLQFLRRQTILLEPGEHQFDIGVNYINDLSDFPTLISDGMNVNASEVEARQRLLLVPMELRVGLTKYTQAFVNVPFGWSNSEVAFNGQEVVDDEGGIGDVSAGLTKQVVIGNEYYPDVLASLAFSAPTGNSSLVTALGTPGASLGQGFWTLTGGLSFIQTYDPVVFFYGLGYSFRFQDDFGNDIEIEPGDQVFYRFGAGFAVNPHVTLSAAFTGSFIGKDKVNGVEVAGSIREPMSVRLAATISRRKSSKTHSSFKLIEPFVNFGLNEDSVDTIIGITWTH